ncbi:hypothetical protein [Kutzneria chonburiensis]|uniref:Uncharacterized protein n=1 Tax=Kutzneria chonburiensis TaxID=1483604 RepID=A0ABV6N552_9PSEU
MAGPDSADSDGTNTRESASEPASSEHGSDVAEYVIRVKAADRSAVTLGDVVGPAAAHMADVQRSLGLSALGDSARLMDGVGGLRGVADYLASVKGMAARTAVFDDVVGPAAAHMADVQRSLGLSVLGDPARLMDGVSGITGVADHLASVNIEALGAVKFYDALMPTMTTSFGVQNAVDYMTRSQQTGLGVVTALEEFRAVVPSVISNLAGASGPMSGVNFSRTALAGLVDGSRRMQEFDVVASFDNSALWRGERRLAEEAVNRSVAELLEVLATSTARESMKDPGSSVNAFAALADDDLRLGLTNYPYAPTSAALDDETSSLLDQLRSNINDRLERMGISGATRVVIGTLLFECSVILYFSDHAAFAAINDVFSFPANILGWGLFVFAMSKKK